MTTFAELEALVVEQTRRPEVTSITQSAIRTATLRAHHVDFFRRDLQIGQLPYTPSNVSFYDFSNIYSSLTRLRSFQKLEGVDATTATPVEELEYRDIDDLYDSDNVRRLSIYNMIGSTLRIYPQMPTGVLNLYYYANPITSSVGYSSWIANDFPDELAMWAAAIVFARTGFAEMAKEFQTAHITPFKESLLSSQLFGNVN